MAGEERNLIPKVQIKDVKKIYEGLLHLILLLPFHLQIGQLI